MDLQVYSFLLFVSLASFLNEQTKKIIGLLVILGVILFSGSIYGLATNALTAFDFKTIGYVTPLGGILLILGWLILLVNVLKIKAQ